MVHRMHNVFSYPEFVSREVEARRYIVPCQCISRENRARSSFACGMKRYGGKRSLLVQNSLLDLVYDKFLVLVDLFFCDASVLEFLAELVPDVVIPFFNFLNRFHGDDRTFVSSTLPIIHKL